MSYLNRFVSIPGPLTYTIRHVDYYNARVCSGLLPRLGKARRRARGETDRLGHDGKQDKILALDELVWLSLGMQRHVQSIKTRQGQHEFRICDCSATSVPQ